MKQELKEIAINRIDVEENYRKTFDEKKLSELSKSIRKNGVIQPIVVRIKGERFSLIAGERRLRASILADKVTIPAVVREIDDHAYAIELQLIENIQKEQVPYMEEAYGFARLREAGILDVKEIAERIGKHENYVYVALQLTRMAEDARRIAERGWISKGVAWEIAKLKDPAQQEKAANDLARTKGSDALITASGAKNYIRDNFGDSAGAMKKQRNATFGLGSHSDYAANWKHHLVRFTGEQFDEFKKIVRGRTEIAVISEAVDAVMRESGTKVAI
jgi:ParB/RepB/Spo0J family partition protein